jgi:hypothetical protein
MSKHTPGPWKVAITSDGWDGETTCIEGANGESVVLGWGYDASGLAWGQSAINSTAEDDQRCPDACLISAAPTLLYALKQILQDLPVNRDWLDPRVEQIARLAVSQAEGADVP